MPQGVSITFPFQRSGEGVPSYELLLDVLCGEGEMQRWGIHFLICDRDVYALGKKLDSTVNVR